LPVSQHSLSPMILGMDISSNAEMICLANQEESGVRVRITEES